MSVYVHGPEFRGIPWGWSFIIKIVTCYLYFSIFAIIYVYICTCLYMCMGLRLGASPGDGVTSNCKLPDVGAENRTRVLYKIHVLYH